MENAHIDMAIKDSDLLQPSSKYRVSQVVVFVKAEENAKDKNKRLGYTVIRQAEQGQSQLDATQSLVATPDTPNDVAGHIRLTDSKIVRVADNVKSKIEKKMKKYPEEHQSRPESPPPERRPLAGKAPLAPT
ncbi:MAG: hypothetical protein PHI85_04180 [Victivallaceae bacterium]|nr:hypothetical protein [Victivallaceae bacterium]